MKMKHVLSAGFGALALGLVATAAQAAPLTVSGGAMAATAGETGLVEKAHWYGGYYYDYHPRYHYWHHHYNYGYYYKPYYGYYYYPRYYRHHHHWY